MNLKMLETTLDNMVFDYYCFVDHMDFMTVEERQVSSISFEELGIL
ncbi:MAG: hypothetical protein IJH65_13860 [Methanobrevibacter sp.]|nr:hypothetical protein [Methanobrevibacter sp.]